MDWFEKITGFAEKSYEDTQGRLTVREGKLVGAGERAWSMGRLETPSLADLRQRFAALPAATGRTRVSCMTGDVRALHARAENRNAVFQVASQFNLLEMVAPHVTPEHGVTCYQVDRTQGPACAIAAGAGTIYRNYLAPVGNQAGQRADRQIDCLADLGQALGGQQHRLREMRNGYALCTRDGLLQIDARLRECDEALLDELRGRLRIGLHWCVDVTDSAEPGHHVTQVFCSALPVSYTSIPSVLWTRFALLVLEAAYEATLLAAALNRAVNGADLVYLTRLGGGAFGNDPHWIAAAMRRAIRQVAIRGLDVRLVSHGAATADLLQIAHEFA